MAKTHRHQQVRPIKGEQGSILMEAVLAATTALVALAAIAPMFEQQIRLSKAARDTDLVEMAANQDINAIRQFSRYMGLRTGPYSNSLLKGLPYGYDQKSGIVNSYQPVNRRGCSDKTFFYKNTFLDDLKNYVLVNNMEINNPPRVLGLAEDITPPSSSLQGRYKLTRVMAIDSDASIPTVRLTYTLESLQKERGKPGFAPDLAFQRTAEIQVEQQNGC